MSHAKYNEAAIAFEVPSWRGNPPKREQIKDRQRLAQNLFEFMEGCGNLRMFTWVAAFPLINYALARLEWKMGMKASESRRAAYLFEISV